MSGVKSPYWSQDLFLVKLCDSLFYRAPWGLFQAGESQPQAWFLSFPRATDSRSFLVLVKEEPLRDICTFAREDWVAARASR